MTKPPLHYRIAQRLGLVGHIGYSGLVNGPLGQNTPSPLYTFMLWLLKRGERRKLRQADDSYKNKLDAAINKVANEISSHSALPLPTNGTWVDSNIVLEPGDSITAFAVGRLFFSKSMEISLGTQTCIWYRIGTGNINRFSNNFELISSDHSGPLYFCVAEPGAFKSQAGDPNENRLPYKKTGDIELRLIRWKQAPKLSIKAAAEIEPSVFGDVYQSLSTCQELHHWRHLWRTGKSDIFSVDESDGSISCRTHGDIGIIQYPVDLPLDKDLSLSWSWLVTELPSDISETIRHTHDYLSIAVEFDDGLDLTYMWSSTLEKDTVFQCPLPWWDQRETHWVLRNPQDGTGRWFDEQRNLLEDYTQAIGPSVPARVVSVWLIAGSRWQNIRGSCQYRAIKLANAEETVVVHP
ncbi:DUF3047 domain-containing protein [Alcaligenaceae bacterium]|nr:DUF3047 domain-containing protein [Alcaligenaceae bacterium]